MEVAGSDLLGGDRQRNIFPLPPISDDFPSEPHSLGWSSMVNQGINALNVLAGCTNSLNSKKKPTRVQRRALQHISDAFKDVSVVHECDPGRSSLDDLCSSSRLYQVDRSDVVSYARELVSWPKVETSPIPLERCLPVADIEWLATWRQHMLKPEGSCDNPNSPKRPYMDPILKHKQNDYENFIRELRQRHMIKFKLDTSDAGDLGIFFVRKKNGSQRLIFDTRILNNKFLDPPSTDLPSADAFTRVEMPENQPFYIGSGDLANAFYTLSVPDDLGRMFTLPAVRADRIGIDEVDGNTLRPGTMVCPYLIVLPMGWSWALHLCQSVMMHAISQSGFCSQQIISDKRAPVRISNSDDMACGGYVDNFVVIGNDPEAVNAGLARISERLRSLGLTVHEEEPASLHATFVGLDFNGSSGVVSLKPQRILNLQKAIRELLLRNFASGDLLQLILGHITWALMCRREGLSILKSCYAFVHQNQSKACRLWPSVRFELDLIASLLPLFRTKLNVGWSDDICASDSSPFGYGICHRKGEREVIQAVGSQSERWRFRFEDAVDARRHAAKTGGFKELSKSQCNGGHAEVCKDEHVNHIFDEGFNNSIFDEVPHALLNPNDWSVVWSHPWKHQDNILHTEALALVWSIEHALSPNRNFGKRILFLADNLPLTLSVCKGRAKSSFLTRPLRKICALALATGSRIHVRWIPSEWNVADQPSRALNQWSSRGLKSWFSDDCSSGSRFERARRKFGSPPRFEGHTDKEPGAGQGEDLEEAGSGETGCNSSPWHDIPGVPKCENTNDSGLHKEVSGVSGLDEHASDQHSITPGPRLCSSGVPRGPVRGQSGCQRRGEGHRSDQVFLAPFSKGNPPDQPGTERLELGSSASTADASANRGAVGHNGRFSAAGEPGVSSETFHPVCDIHEAWGMQSVVGEAISETTGKRESVLQLLGDPSPPHGRSHPRKDRDFRRVRCSGFRSLGQRFSGEVGSWEGSTAAPVVNSPRNFQGSIQQDHQSASIRSTGSNLVCSAARRGDTRRVGKEETHFGSEAARQVVVGQFPKKVRQRGPTSSRALQGAQVNQGVRPVSAAESACFHGKSIPSPKESEWNHHVTKRMWKRAVKPSRGPKSLTGAQLLRRIFKNMSRAFRPHFYGVFLDIFSGDGSVGRYLSRLGYPVISIDICDDSRFDILNHDVAAVIFGWIKSGSVLGIWLATPRTSWSRARHGPANSSWGPIRTSQHIYGIPGLSPEDVNKVRVGNQTMRFTANVIRIACHHHVPTFLESSCNSMLWLAPPLLSLCGRDCSRSLICDFCQYGTRWRKRTRIQGWFVQPSAELTHTCSGRHGICCASGKYHIILKGQDPVSRQLWTHLAQPYPLKFAQAAARALITSFEQMHNFQLSKRFGL